ncbi:MAG: hypothetical protein LBO74_06170 [Candidatus Symbiothrix sp.]|jgi:hypothetical protein|nr:hypothetical protein [Candidatus Symbiothrix sp.]
MELDELKNVWASLDERLNKQEMLKGSILKEMLQSKTTKTVSKLINLDISSICVLLVAIPLCVFIIERVKSVFWGNVTIIFTAIFSFIYLIWAIYKLHGLMKIDFSKSINDNIYYMNRYNIHIKWDKIASLVYIPIFVLLGILTYAENKVSVTLWIFLICVLLLAILLTYWSWKLIYDKNIASIRKSLEELKELEEE